MTETRIVSFVVRFVQPADEGQAAPWHGVVRHVQSREEARFTRLEEVLEFMSRYVPLAEEAASHLTLAPAGVTPEPGAAVEDEEG